MDGIREAYQALLNVVNDPDLDLDPDDKTDLLVAIGVLVDYLH